MESENTQSGDIYTVLGWLEKNRKNLITAVVVIILVGVGVSYYNWRKTEGQIIAGEALSSVLMANLGTNVSANSLLSVANSHAGTEAGSRALLAAATQQFVDGKVSDAQASFARFISDYPESTLIAQAKYGLAVCIESQGKTAEAITAYKEVVDRYAEDNTRPSGKLALGRLYEADGKLELARDSYMDIARDSRSAVGMEAQTRLLGLLQKHPELQPKAPETSAPRAAIAPSAAPAK
ncbi:MAG: hypothetical protein RLY20_602 [Verrucomicrobiota bacterium]